MNYFQKITSFSGLLDAQIVHHLNVHKKVTFCLFFYETEIIINLYAIESTTFIVHKTQVNIFVHSF